MSRPPGSPLVDSTAIRNTRRSKLDSKGLSPIVTGKKGKSPAEGNIVPPISVLIVDGMKFTLFRASN